MAKRFPGLANELDRDRMQSVDMVPNPLYAGGAMGSDNAEYDSSTFPPPRRILSTADFRAAHGLSS